MMLTNICGGAINWGYVRFQSDPTVEVRGYMCVPSFVAFRGIWWLSVSGVRTSPSRGERRHARGG